MDTRSLISVNSRSSEAVPLPGGKLRGYYGVGIECPKIEANVGTLWRSAAIMGASFMVIIGPRYRRLATDTMASWKHIPLYHYNDFDEFYRSGIPYDCMLVGVELVKEAVMINAFEHPKRCIYLMGAEDKGLSNAAVEKCHKLVQLPGNYCMNVSVAGSIVMYDRWAKRA